MRYFIKDLQAVIDSGRDDFDFHDPSVRSIRQTFSSQSGFVSLQRLCTKIKTGRTPAKSAYVNEGVRILKVKNISGAGIKWEEKAYITRDLFDRALKAQILEDDILMLSSAHTKSYIGRCDIVKNLHDQASSGECAAVGELIIIRADKDLILPDYLLTFLRLEVVRDEIRKMVKGQSAHLYPQDLEKLQIVVPSPIEQEEIAEVATNAERLYREQTAAATAGLSDARRRVQEMVYELNDAFAAHGQTLINERPLIEQGSLPLGDDFIDIVISIDNSE